MNKENQLLDVNSCTHANFIRSYLDSDDFCCVVEVLHSGRIEMERDFADSKNLPDTGSRKCQGLKRMLKALLFWRRGTSSRTIKVSNEYIENVEIYETINRQPDANQMQTMAGMRHIPLNLENIDYIDLTQSEGILQC